MSIKSFQNQLIIIVFSAHTLRKRKTTVFEWNRIDRHPRDDYNSGMKIDKIAVFHYHLLPGGVTSVISGGMEAVIRYIPAVKEILLITGNAENSGSIIQQLKHEAEDAGRKDITIESHHLPLAGYLEKIDGNPDKMADKLAEIMTELFGNYIWWIHNYHIGKNSVFTRAVIRTIRHNQGQRIYLQIHDFPESGRFTNLMTLKGIEELYPLRAGVHYITINQRDRNILIKAGIPEKSVTLLANPVKSRKLSLPADKEDKIEIRRKMEIRWGKEFPGWNPEARTAFYPVRSIRRKNILEGGLLALLSPDPLNLIVTLPGVSTQEKDYSALVKTLFTSGTIPGIWGTGLEREDPFLSFSNIERACDLVLSTSLQEGFGYMFIEAAIWGKKLFCRKLDVLDEIIPVLSPKRITTYDKLLVPWNSRLMLSTREEYINHISALTDILPPSITNELENKVFGITGGDTVDFSFLSISGQAEILNAIAKDPGFRRETAELNIKTLLELTSAVTKQSIPAGNREIDQIESFFGLPDFARKLENIFSNGELDNRIFDELSSASKDSVLKAFNTPENQRLIFKSYNGSPA